MFSFMLQVVYSTPYMLNLVLKMRIYQLFLSFLITEMLQLKSFVMKDEDPFIVLTVKPLIQDTPL